MTAFLSPPPASLAVLQNIDAIVRAYDPQEPPLREFLVAYPRMPQTLYLETGAIAGSQIDGYTDTVHVVISPYIAGGLRDLSKHRCSVRAADSVRVVLHEQRHRLDAPAVWIEEGRTEATAEDQWAPTWHALCKRRLPLLVGLPYEKWTRNIRALSAWATHSPWWKSRARRWRDALSVADTATTNAMIADAERNRP